MEMKDMNLLGIIGLVGAIILVVGVFLGWLSLDVGGSSQNFSGLDIFNKKGSIDDLDVKYTFVPLAALICGIISLALMILPTFMNSEKFATINNILGLVALVLAVVVVICGILFYTQTFGDYNYKLTSVFDVKIGFWLTLVGGIITLVGGLMPIINNKLLNKN